VAQDVSALRRATALLRVGALLVVCTGAVSMSPPAAATDPEPPSIRAKVSGVVGANGWYRSEVSVKWAVSDPTGIVSSDGCGPRMFRDDTAGSRVRCTATNGAKVSRTVSVTIKIDKTPPALGNVSVASGDGANQLAWKSSSDSDTAMIERSARGAKDAPLVVFRGAGGSFTDQGIQNGREYSYVVRSYDDAGNASRPVSVRALPKVLVLQRLPYLPRVATPPILRWSTVPRAAYYHVQLFRSGKRILAAWPRGPQLALRPTWSWRGHRYRLDHGTYRWYVWAGFGRRSSAHYKRIGTAAFAVRAL
jgi:hypothetical protein